MRGLLIGIVLTAVMAAPALAESCREKCQSQSDSCMSSASDDQARSACDTTRNSCAFVCGSDDGGGSAPAPRVTKFGAIAYSPATGGHGYTFNYNSRAAAERDALLYCRDDSKGSPDCRVVAWFYNACGALARASDGTWGAEIGNNRQQASNAAIGLCTRTGGRDCDVIRWVCTGT